jgi:gluconokinase
MGVAGSGKSTVGAVLAERLGAPFVEGDGLHPERNVAKMASGLALDEADRAPWIERVRQTLCDHQHVVVSCSALKRSHRDELRRAHGVRFVFLDASADAARVRAAGRADHFMGPDMIAGQMVTLERPGPDETDIVTVDAHAAVDTIVETAIRVLAMPAATD